jgi:hypothetical protein
MMARWIPEVAGWRGVGEVMDVDGSLKGFGTPRSWMRVYVLLLGWTSQCGSAHWTFSKRKCEHAN